MSSPGSEGSWERVSRSEPWEDDSWDEELYPDETSSSASDGGENGNGDEGERVTPLGVGLGTALLLGATVGLGVGVSVAALATIASRQIQQQAPSLLEKLGFQNLAERRPLNAEKWCEACDGEGRLTDFHGLLVAISKGGICPSIRVTVWPFILGLVKPDSTARERARDFDELRKRYASLVDSCKKLQRELVEGTDHENPKFLQSEEYKENRRILNLDLVRTDFASMTLSQLDGTIDADAVDLGVNDHIESAEYLSSEQKHYAKYMGKLLLCYSIHDPQTGYCQGMTDLIQPFAQIFHDQSISFWAFEAFMERARENFMTDESGIMTRISLIKMVLADVSPDLFSRLNEIGAESFFFTYRMILVLLRRELSIEDSMLFWEILWTEDLFKAQEQKNDVPEFLIFSLVALIMEKSDEIMGACSSESDVVHMFCNLKINVWHMVEEARFVRNKWVALA